MDSEKKSTPTWMVIVQIALLVGIPVLLLLIAKIFLK